MINLKEFFTRLGRKAKAKAQTTVQPPRRGLVLSGGGSRAAYQVGALKALQEHIELDKAPFSVIVGSSLGAVNGILLAASAKRGFREAVDVLEEIWLERTFENTFGGSLSLTLLRSLRTGFVQYLAPGPHQTNLAIFDPAPLRQRIDEVLFHYGGANVGARRTGLKAIGVMTTIEGDEREGLLIVNARKPLEGDNGRGLSYKLHYVENLSSSHAFASAALPFVLPPAQLQLDAGEVKLVDGGISDNIPVDAATRFGAEELYVIDTSGKKWWFDRYGQPHYSSEPWTVPAPTGSYCLRPPHCTEIRSTRGLGSILKLAIGNTTRDYIRALGPTWPVYRLLRTRMGEELALETMSYAVIHPPFIRALMELGYEETKAILAKQSSSPEQTV